MAARRPDPTVCISGATGEGLPELLALMQETLVASMTEVRQAGVAGGILG